MTAFKEDKHLELTKTQVAYDIVRNNPLIQNAPDKLREITVDLLRKADISNPEAKVPSLKEIQQQQVEIKKEAGRQLEAEKQQQNVAEAAKRGYDKETVKQEALGELANEISGGAEKLLPQAPGQGKGKALGKEK
jgi:hypothetical protein